MNIRRYLDSRGLSVAAFAAQIGVDKSLVYRWLNGMVPRGRNLLRLIKGTEGVITADEMLNVRRSTRNRNRAA